MDKLIFPAVGNRRIYNWLFVGVVVFVVAFKLHDIFLPYFWDELGVYSQAANYQYIHGLSLMPSAVPPEFSRGHPLLFTFFYALAFKIFGNEIYVAHIFSLVISILLLWFVYLKTARYFTPLAAIVSVILLAVQPVFLAQSSLVLPEMMLSLFIFLSLTSYFEKKYFLFALFASMAILTKESAIVLPVTALAYSLVQGLIFKNGYDGLKVRNLLLTLLPYCVFGGFLLIQKEQNGWYFFPYHLGSISFEPAEFWWKLSKFFDFIFWNQGRYWCEKIIFIGIGVALIRHQLNWRGAGKNFFTLAAMFILAFLSFSSLTFYMDRYIMAVIFPIFIMVAVSLTCISTNKIFITVATLFLCAIGFKHTEDSTFEYDTDMGYRRQVHALQQAIDYVAKVSKPGETMNGNFPSNYAMSVSQGGYLKGKNINADVVSNLDVDYFIYSNPGGGNEIDQSKYEITLRKSFKDGFASVTVYRVREWQNAKP